VTRIKICGITNMPDAELAFDLGADAIGVVFDPASTRYAGADSTFLQDLKSLRPFGRIVAVFGRQWRQIDPEVFDAVQAVEFIAGEPNHGLETILAVRLRTAADVQIAARRANEHAALVVDAYDKQKMGGTGKTADWQLAHDLVRQSQAKVVLAGGLTPQNVAQAISQVEPHGVDVSTGVEASPGKKDPEKLTDFIQAVRRKKVRER